MGLLKKLAELVIEFPEDLGMQRGPMLSPEHFRRYIRPSYQRLMQPVRDRGDRARGRDRGKSRRARTSDRACPLFLSRKESMVADQSPRDKEMP